MVKFNIILSKEENIMVELIVGKKGKGKTKVLLDRVNNAVKEANGSIVYLDKSTKHMYELNNCLLYTSPSPRDRG